VREILTLDAPYRRVLPLRWFEDHDPGEIAEDTGASPATVRSQLRRGHEKLRERLDVRWQGDGAAWTSDLVPITRGGKQTVMAAGLDPRLLESF